MHGKTKAIKSVVSPFRLRSSLRQSGGRCAADLHAGLTAEAPLYLEATAEATAGASWLNDGLDRTDFAKFAMDGAPVHFWQFGGNAGVLRCAQNDRAFGLMTGLLVCGEEDRGDYKDKGKSNSRFLHCAAHDETVSSFGRNDGVAG
jgi:hypothetical protein